MRTVLFDNCCFQVILHSLHAYRLLTRVTQHNTHAPSSADSITVGSGVWPELEHGNHCHDFVTGKGCDEVATTYSLSCMNVYRHMFLPAPPQSSRSDQAGETSNQTIRQVITCNFAASCSEIFADQATWLKKLARTWIRKTNKLKNMLEKICLQSSNAK
jgi:hypothetical protein